MNQLAKTLVLAPFVAVAAETMADCPRLEMAANPEFVDSAKKNASCYDYEHSEPIDKRGCLVDGKRYEVDVGDPFWDTHTLAWHLRKDPGCEKQPVYEKIAKPEPTPIYGRLVEDSIETAFMKLDDADAFVLDNSWSMHSGKAPDGERLYDKVAAHTFPDGANLYVFGNNGPIQVDRSQGTQQAILEQCCYDGTPLWDTLFPLLSQYGSITILSDGQDRGQTGGEKGSAQYTPEDVIAEAERTRTVVNAVSLVSNPALEDLVEQTGGQLIQVSNE